MEGKPSDQSKELDIDGFLEKFENEGFSAFLCRWKDKGAGEEHEVLLSHTDDMDENEAEVMIVNVALGIIDKMRSTPGCRQFLDEVMKVIQA